MDNPKKKKLDGKRVSMQKHEIAYIRKMAKKIAIACKKEIELCRKEKIPKWAYVTFVGGDIKDKKDLDVRTSTILKICKAVIKLTDGKKNRKTGKR